MSQLIGIERDLLIEMIKNAVKAGITEFSPYPSPSVNNKKLLTRNEVAEILKVSPNTVSKYIRQGKLHATLLNGIYRISESELAKVSNKKH